MITEISGKDELLQAIDGEVSQLLSLFSSLDENKINTIPYEGSWTAAQLLIHITKSTRGMAKAMQKDSKPAERAVGEKIPFLKKIFLDFEKKLDSPDFIVPEDGVYKKEVIIEELNQSFELLKENASKTDLNDMVDGLPFGSVTKLEILHFVVYHTQRHLHQMKKICDALTIKSNSIA